MQIGKFTGVVKDEYVEVEMYFGVKRLCRPVFSGPFVGIPYTDWVDTYKDKFLAVISFEEEDEERALLMGLIPLKSGITVTEGLEDNIYVLAKNFRLRIDDKNKLMVFDKLTSGGVFAFGDKDAEENAILGKKFKKLWEDFFDELIKVTVPTPSGTSGKPINATQLTAIRNQIGDCLSQILKIKE